MQMSKATETVNRGSSCPLDGSLTGAMAVDIATIAPFFNLLSTMGSMLHHVEVQHTRREGNKAAHGLAQYAQYVDDYVTWMEETPTIIESAVASDVNQLIQT
uniref:RNase H type-1 domain-containing protein n=1 Tax=Quercus lobata TaxID=97700 RepID=A0A7N2LNA8_QUELO